MTQITPVLTVDTLAPSIAFWRDRLGFTVVTEVPGDDGPVFAILSRDDTLVMYQTRASVAADIPTVAGELSAGPSLLYVTVDSLDETISALDGIEVVVERRTTFYGADELGCREPGGHIVIFAEMSTK